MYANAGLWSLPMNGVGNQREEGYLLTDYGVHGGRGWKGESGVALGTVVNLQNSSSSTVK